MSNYASQTYGQVGGAYPPSPQMNYPPTPGQGPASPMANRGPPTPSWAGSNQGQGRGGGGYHTPPMPGPQYDAMGPPPGMHPFGGQNPVFPPSPQGPGPHGGSSDRLGGSYSGSSSHLAMSQSGHGPGHHPNKQSRSGNSGATAQHEGRGGGGHYGQSAAPPPPPFPPQNGPMSPLRHYTSPTGQAPSNSGAASPAPELGPGYARLPPPSNQRPHSMPAGPPGGFAAPPSLHPHRHPPPPHFMGSHPMAGVGVPPTDMHPMVPPHPQHHGAVPTMPYHQPPPMNNPAMMGPTPQIGGGQHPRLKSPPGPPTLSGPNMGHRSFSGPMGHNERTGGSGSLQNSFSSQPQSPAVGIAEANPDLKQFLETKQLVRSIQIGKARDDAVAHATQLLSASGTTLPTNGNGEPVCRLAIDANHVVKELQQQVSQLEPLWFLLGPYPDSLLSRLSEIVFQLQMRGFVPVFIFAGMAVHGDVESFVNTLDEMRGRDEIWYSVDQRIPVSLEQVERAFDVFLGEDVEMMLMRYLRDVLRVEVYRAPFLQWGQMVALTLPQLGCYCSALWGPAETLLFDSVERVYLDFNFQQDTASYCEKAEVIKSLFPGDVDRASLFLDLALLTATHQSLTLIRPPLDNATLPYMLPVLRRLANNKEKVSDMICASFPDKKSANSHTWKFLKGRCFVKHCMVLVPGSDTESLVPLSKLVNPSNLVPRNLTGVLGSRLPLMLYYFQFVGLLSVSTMTTVSQNYIRDDNPVSDSLQYRQCMETIISLRTQVLYQLVQFLQSNEEYYHRVKVSWIRWYEPITAPVRRPPEIRLAHWSLQDLPDSEDLANVNFQSVIAFSNRGTNNSDVRYDNLNQVLHAVYLKSLDLLGYFTHANVEEEVLDQGVEVSGMSCYSETIKYAVQSSRFVEQCVLLIELLRTRSLSLTRFVCITEANFHSQQLTPLPEMPVADAVSVLAARISSLLPIPLRADVPWSFDYDRELMTFNVLARSMHRTLRTTTEVIASSMFLDGSATIPVAHYAELPRYLPFKTPPNTVAGILTIHLLATVDTRGTPAERLAALESRFPAIADISEALRLLFDYWEDAYYVVQELNHKDPTTVDENFHCVMTMVVSQIRTLREALLGETPEPSFDPHHDVEGGNSLGEEEEDQESS